MVRKRLSNGRRAGLASALQPRFAEVRVMANEECAHCGVLITEWSTVAKRDGKIFCCANCANAHMSSQRASAETATG
ncbi:MAG: hypothetical protein E6J15_10855 [Chloroflexi bacterium]|nr:MAG: hypothetical protein E6J15_10855 [Chloroflexota bacterium]